MKSFWCLGAHITHHGLTIVTKCIPQQPQQNSRAPPLLALCRLACSPALAHRLTGQTGQKVSELLRDERRVVFVSAMAGLRDQHHLARLRADNHNQHSRWRTHSPARAHAHTRAHTNTNHKLPATVTSTCCFAAHACSIPAALELCGLGSLSTGGRQVG